MFILCISQYYKIMQNQITEFWNLTFKLLHAFNHEIIFHWNVMTLISCIVLYSSEIESESEMSFDG